MQTSTLKVWFRFDCGPNIGLGHAVRCLAIVEALKKKSILCTVAHSESSTYYLPSHLMQGVNTIAIPDEQELFEFLPGTTEPIPDVLVIDHYAGARRNLSAPLFSNIRKVLIDDFEIHCDLPCDILINPNAGSELTPLATELCLLGPKYAPIQDNISQLAGRWQSKPEQDNLYQCLISIGATDPQNFTSSILKTLARCPQRDNFKFTVLLSSSAPHLEAVKALCSTLKHELLLEFLLDAKDMGVLYQQAHCCIGAAGSSAWERCCVGLPTAQLVVADNQRLIQDELLASGAIMSLPHPDDQSFSSMISCFLRVAVECDSSFLDFSIKGQKLVDGKGAQRIAEVLAAGLDI